jgi:choline dehydrogenase-like flavoprotein
LYLKFCASTIQQSYNDEPPNYCFGLHQEVLRFPRRWWRYCGLGSCSTAGRESSAHCRCTRSWVFCFWKGEEEDAVNIPGYYGKTLGSSCDWNFETIPQPGLGGRVLPWPRGKVLGGTSALNFMTWNRASRQDYDAWRELGNPGWGWDDLLSVIPISFILFFLFSHLDLLSC